LKGWHETLQRWGEKGKILGLKRAMKFFRVELLLLVQDT
jgi:hypothetical protein